MSTEFDPISPSPDELDQPALEPPSSWYSTGDAFRSLPRRLKASPSVHQEVPPRPPGLLNIRSAPRHIANVRPLLTPNAETAALAAGDIRRVIRESVQLEVEKRMEALRRTAQYSIVDTGSAPLRSATVMRKHPPLHRIEQHVAQILRRATHRSIAWYRMSIGRPIMAKSTSMDNSWNDAIANLDQEGGLPYATETSEGCMADAYVYESAFRMRDNPQFATGKSEDSDAQRELLSHKGYKSRLKRSQQSESSQKMDQCDALMRRARREEHEGIVLNRHDSWEVVGNDEVCKIRWRCRQGRDKDCLTDSVKILGNCARIWFYARMIRFVLMITAQGRGFSAGDVGIAFRHNDRVSRRASFELGPQTMGPIT